jgi:hypothetical protein
VLTDAEPDDGSMNIPEPKRIFGRPSQMAPEKKEEYARKSSVVHTALTGFRTREGLFQKIKRGNREDCLQIEQWIKDDPKDNLRSPDDPDRLCNRPYHDGKTPLFAACENGNLKVVETLLRNKANPYQ